MIRINLIDMGFDANLLIRTARGNLAAANSSHIEGFLKRRAAEHNVEDAWAAENPDELPEWRAGQWYSYANFKLCTHQKFGAAHDLRLQIAARIGMPWEELWPHIARIYASRQQQAAAAAEKPLSIDERIAMHEMSTEGQIAAILDKFKVVESDISGQFAIERACTDWLYSRVELLEQRNRELEAYTESKYALALGVSKRTIDSLEKIEAVLTGHGRWLTRLENTLASLPLIGKRFVRGRTGTGAQGGAK